jgi:hypothetical protein
VRCAVGVVGIVLTETSIGRRVTNRIVSRKFLERYTIEGDSPVGENHVALWDDYPSSAEHEKFCANLPGPPGKAKYSPVTDSEPVP